MRCLHKIVVTAMILSSVLTLVGLGAVAVSAGDPPPQHSHTLIQNMSSDQANVLVEFYDPNGTITHTEVFTLAGNGARTIHTSDYPELGQSWRGSIVVSSNKPIVASVINYGYSSAHAIYEGLDSSEAATELFMPSIHWNSLGQVSTVAIQNVDSADAEVEITYYPRNGTVVQPITVTIPRGASNFRDALTDCSGCGEPPVGVMRVKSLNGMNLVAAVQENVHDGIYAYKASSASAGHTTILLPSVHRNPLGQFSHILVQNMSDLVDTTVTITYFDQAGTPTDEFTKNLSPNGSYTFHTTDGWPETPSGLGDVGNARITSNPEPILVTVIETVLDRPYCYNGFRPSDASNTILIPSVHRNPLGQFSHILVQNTSSSLSAAVTIKYYDQDGNMVDEFDRTINPEGSYTFHTTDGWPETPTHLGDVGSAVITSVGGQLVATVIETIHMVPAIYAGFPQ